MAKDQLYCTYCTTSLLQYRLQSTFTNSSLIRLCNEFEEKVRCHSAISIVWTLVLTVSAYWKLICANSPTNERTCEFSHKRKKRRATTIRCCCCALNTLTLAHIEQHCWIIRHSSQLLSAPTTLADDNELLNLIQKFTATLWKCYAIVQLIDSKSQLSANSISMCTLIMKWTWNQYIL